MIAGGGPDGTIACRRPRPLRAVLFAAFVVAFAAFADAGIGDCALVAAGSSCGRAGMADAGSGAAETEAIDASDESAKAVSAVDSKRKTRRTGL
jgi:hypothetical protein